MNRKTLDAAIQEIRDYTNGHAELRVAHHFLYDLPLDKKAGKPEVMVMGINPGEPERCWKACAGPTEETWNFDFHEKTSSGRDGGSIRWRKNATFFADGKPAVFTELFFWSSRNKEQFKQRFGPLWRSNHLCFCMGMNRILIKEYQPKSVIFVGVTDSKKVAKEFGLDYVYTLKSSSNRLVENRLVEHYRDDESRPWYFTKHWSGSHGFSNAQKEQIRNYIRCQSGMPALSQ